MEQIYPTTAEQLLSSAWKGKDKFFLLCRFEKNDADLSIIIEPDFPIAVNDESVRDEIAAQQGVKLPTRKEISKGALKDFYTVGTGAALWINGTARFYDPDKIYIIQNTPDKVPNGNKFKFPSGLASTTLIDQAFIELNEETGILIPDEADDLIALDFNLPTELPEVSTDARITVLQGRKERENYIRAELNKRYPEHAKTTIHWRTIDTHIEHKSSKRARFNLLGNTFDNVAHVLVDDSVNSVNIHFPIVADLSPLRSAFGVRFDEAMIVDPEGFGRNHGLYTAKETAKLDTIPAPRDYLQRLTA